MSPYKPEWYRFRRTDPWPDLKWYVEKEPRLTVGELVCTVVFSVTAALLMYLVLLLEKV